MITLTITSCKRPDLFKTTLLSFWEKCLDIDLISKIIWSDDHSSAKDFEEMLCFVYYLFPEVPVVFEHRTNGQKGLGYSLNFILKHLDTRYNLHLEDDWEFVKKGHFITEALEILEAESNIGQVLLKDRPMFEMYSTKFGKQYFLWEKGVARDGQNVRHAGFTLNPTVSRFLGYKEKYGLFNLTSTEGTWAETSYQDGVRTATLTENYIEHIGIEQCSFVLNHTKR